MVIPDIILWQGKVREDLDSCPEDLQHANEVC